MLWLYIIFQAKSYPFVVFYMKHNIELLLNGVIPFNVKEHLEIARAVQAYICDTGRFAFKVK